MEIPQWLINWSLGGAAAIFGWFARTLWGAQQKLTDDIQELGMKLAENYPTNHRIEQLERALFAKLDRIEDKLDQKADKRPSG